jgi:type II secretory pathway component PulJ
MMACRRAFTLMEVLLSILLVVGLVGAVYGMYDSVLDLREQFAADATRLAAHRGIMKRLTRDCRNAIVYPLPEIDPDTEEMSVETGLVGEADSIEFVSVRLPGAAAWAIRQIGDRPIPPEPDVEKVTWSMAWDEETGQPIGLTRTTRRVLGLATRQEAGRTRLVSDSIRCLFARYHDGTGWVNHWGGEDLPLAVEVWLSPSPLPEGLAGQDAVDYLSTLPEVHRRVIYLPGGTKAQSLPFGGPNAPGGGRVGGGRIGGGSVGSGTRPGGGGRP